MTLYCTIGVYCNRVPYWGPEVQWWWQHITGWWRGTCLWGCLTFDFQSDLVFSFTQEAAGHTCVCAFVFWLGSFNLQGPIVVDGVMTTINATALSILKPLDAQNTGKYDHGLSGLNQHHMTVCDCQLVSGQIETRVWISVPFSLSNKEIRV